MSTIINQHNTEPSEDCLIRKQKVRQVSPKNDAIAQVLASQGEQLIPA